MKSTSILFMITAIVLTAMSVSPSVIHPAQLVYASEEDDSSDQSQSDQSPDQSQSDQSCPDGTQKVHNMCLTQDEIDERNAKSGEFAQCTVENGLGHDAPGLLGCARNFFGR